MFTLHLIFPWCNNNKKNMQISKLTWCNCVCQWLICAITVTELRSPALPFNKLHELSQSKQNLPRIVRVRTMFFMILSHTVPQKLSEVSTVGSKWLSSILTSTCFCILLALWKEDVVLYYSNMIWSCRFPMEVWAKRSKQCQLMYKGLSRGKELKIRIGHTHIFRAIPFTVVEYKVWQRNTFKRRASVLAQQI